MKIAFYGSSLLSAYWNGAATYYRGILRALAALGHDITFFEPDAYDRQSHRDIEPPEWCRVVVYPATPEGVESAVAQAREADIVVKASGVGYADDILLERVMELAPTHALRFFWDVDAPATLAELAEAPDHPLRRHLGALDGVLTYGGGQPVIDAYRGLGARLCRPIYNGLDPSTHHPAPYDPAYRSDLAFLGNRLPDREARVDAFFFSAARLCPESVLLLGGAGWDDKPMPASVRYIGHVPTARHNALNCSAKTVLNISRESMARTGFSPATRVFEAAGAGACLISDAWEGIETFFRPDSEILVARDGQDVADFVRNVTPERAREIGEAARRRALGQHRYVDRAREVDGLFKELSRLEAVS